tara:strand:+ start:711 stop:842 length:132 start_codon:yes stop_codon:yes gene_type:complete
MTKKIILVVVLLCAIISCGKKGDPVYEDPKKKAAVQSIYLNRA